MKFNPKQTYWVCCQMNKKAIMLQTLSGFRSYRQDYLFPTVILDPEIEAEPLGEQALQALANSRTLDPYSPEISDLFNLEKYMDRYNHSIQILCQELKFRNKSALFHRMKNCDIIMQDGIITIHPTRHIRSDAFGKLRGVEDIILPADSSPAEIGAGLKLGLSLCI